VTCEGPVPCLFCEAQHCRTRSYQLERCCHLYADKVNLRKMADVDMKDVSASTGPEANPPSVIKPKVITVEDVARNAELIVKAVESNQTRLTTRAISRLPLEPLLPVDCLRIQCGYLARSSLSRLVFLPQGLHVPVELQYPENRPCVCV